MVNYRLVNQRHKFAQESISLTSKSARPKLSPAKEPLEGVEIDILGPLRTTP